MKASIWKALGSTAAVACLFLPTQDPPAEKLPAGDLWQRGLDAYRSREFEQAKELFEQAVESDPRAATPQLLLNQAFAALRCREMEQAEWAAEKAAARGGPAWYRLRDFVHGNAHWLRCLESEAETTLIDPDPSSFDRALEHAGNALTAWRRAALGDQDWPGARRNVERALRIIEDLEARREEALKKRSGQDQPPPPPPPETTDDPESEESEEADQPEQQASLTPLSAAELERLLQRLAIKDMEKRELRRERRQLRSQGVEKDW